MGPGGPGTWPLTTRLLNVGEADRQQHSRLGVLRQRQAVGSQVATACRPSSSGFVRTSSLSGSKTPTTPVAYNGVFDFPV